MIEYEKNIVYLTFVIIITLTLITILVFLAYRYVIYPLLNGPMTHENCTIFYNCSPNVNIFGKIKCSCVYYEENCANNCTHPEECRVFIQGCSLK